jgi:murein DD-endopeptidase MepM/ murein hydrolase activator NlpD
MIFPSLKNKNFGYVNLNTEAQGWCSAKGLANTKKHNPLLDPKTCQEMVNDVHAKYSLDYSYGGWMEDRSFLWRGHYLEGEGAFIHLGVDINAPTGTEVAADFDVSVAKIDDDYPEEGGWGPRVILKHASYPIYMIYAHLDREILCKIGDTLQKGTVFAKVGNAPYNGNWFSHCHVQTISADYYAELEKSGDWGQLDGYGSAEDAAVNAKRFVDPLQFVLLW